MAKPNAAERSKLRAGLRQRLGRPTPAEAGRLPKPPDSTPLKRAVSKVKDVAGRLEQRGKNVSNTLTEGVRKIKKSVGR